MFISMMFHPKPPPDFLPRCVGARRALALFLLLLVVIGMSSPMLASPLSGPTTPARSAIDTTTLPKNLGGLYDSTTNDAFGVRIGTGLRSGSAVMHPVINPYYQVHLAGVFFSAELMFSYRDFSALDFGKFSDFHFDSYGYMGKITKIFSDGASVRPYFSGGIAFEVLSDRVDIGFPISAGVLLGESMMWDIAGSVSPLVYLGQGTGLYYSLTIGVRIPGAR